MPYDIFGDRLEHGHCEVHPWVNVEYPCHVCVDGRRQHEQELAMRDQYEAEAQEHYERKMSGQVWIDCLALCVPEESDDGD